MARPSKYSDKLASKILGKIAQGKSLNSICKATDMPSIVTVYAWMHKDEAFLNKYKESKVESADYLAEGIVDIADDVTGDTQRDRLRIDARKWVASKLKPKKYGDKIQADVTGDLTVIIKRLGDK